MSKCPVWYVVALVVCESAGGQYEGNPRGHSGPELGEPPWYLNLLDSFKDKSIVRQHKHTFTIKTEEVRLL